LPDSVLPLEELEKNMIVKALSLYGNNLSKVALVLGLTRQALYRRLEKYEISYHKE
jgi:Response regulator containing CheY-like receiver, AAA-type ATPase, and DNA-binding domains